MVHCRGLNKILLIVCLLGLTLNILAGCTKIRATESYSMFYEITPLFFRDNILQVKLKIEDINGNKDNIQFYLGDKVINIIYCKDDKGSDIFFEDIGDFVSIPTKDKSCIELMYEVKIGLLGKHGYRGMIHDNLVVFDGGQVLLFPVEFYTGSDELTRQLKKVSISSNMPHDWEKVIPYKKIEFPSWHKLHALYNSCFAFGDIQKKQYKKGKTSLYIYTDSNIKLNEETEKGLNSLYDYYLSIFEYELEDYAIILLRKNPRDMQYIIGGAGAKTVGSTFDPDNPRDWQLMSHRMFHAFFESRIDTKVFFKPPQLWFYEGLATYYENISMEHLPHGLKERLKLEPRKLFCMLFKKYVYIKLKYHPLLSIIPMDEETIVESPAKMEFLHYTQAPLVIKAIEDLSYEQTKKEHRTLRFILNNDSNDKALTIKNIVFNTLKKTYSEQFYNMYVLDDEILPLWYLGEEDNEDIKNVVDELNYMEYVIWSWFRLDYENFPLYELSLENLNKLSTIKKVEEVHVAEQDIEEKVRRLSYAVYYALKEFVLKHKYKKFS